MEPAKKVPKIDDEHHTLNQRLDQLGQSRGDSIGDLLMNDDDDEATQVISAPVIAVSMPVVSAPDPEVKALANVIEENQ